MMKRALRIGMAGLAVLGLSTVLASPASAGCLSVDGNGICTEDTGPSVGGGSVPVTMPVEVCYLLDCIPAGSEVVTIPVPGPATVPVPSVHTPIVDDVAPIVDGFLTVVLTTATGVADEGVREVNWILSDPAGLVIAVTCGYVLAQLPMMPVSCGS